MPANSRWDLIRGLKGQSGRGYMQFDTPSDRAREKIRHSQAALATVTSPEHSALRTLA